MPTPNEEYTGSNGTPLVDSTGQATNGPRAGFFLSDQKARDDRILRAGMQIRNLLNEDAAVDDKVNNSGEDWFGGGNDDAGSATEDENEQQPARPVAQQPPRASSAPQRGDVYAGFEHNQRSVDDAYLARKSYYTHPSLSRLSAGLPPPRQSLPSPLASWHSTAAGSPSPAYSPFGLGPARGKPLDAAPIHQHHHHQFAHHPQPHPYGRYSPHTDRPASAGAIPQAQPNDYFAVRPFVHTTAYAPEAPMRRPDGSWS